MRNHRGFQKLGNPLCNANANDLCHKCGKTRHFIRYIPKLKAENKEYQRRGGEKEKRREPIPQKNARK